MASSDIPKLTERITDINVQLHVCDACRLDGKEQEAKYFCTDCEDYMCDTCEAYHKRVKATRSHNILPGDNLPSNASMKNTSNKDGPDSPVQQSAPEEDMASSENKSSPAEKMTPFTKIRPVQGIFLTAKATKHMQIDIEQEESDAYRPLVSGIAFTPDGELLLTDYNNETLRILDTNFAKKKQLSCEGAPYDVAVINKKEAVVALREKKQVLFVKYTPQIFLGRRIILNQTCNGVAASNEHIFVLCKPEVEVDKSSILILDLTGILQRTVNCDEISQCESFITHMNSNPLGNRIYMTGVAGVICMTGDCKVVFNTAGNPYTDLGSGIVVDSNDNMLLSRFSSNDIQALKSDGTQHTAFLTSSDGIEHPTALAYRQSDGLLVVKISQAGLISKLLVFKLS